MYAGREGDPAPRTLTSAAHLTPSTPRLAVSEWEHPEVLILLAAENLLQCRQYIDIHSIPNTVTNLQLYGRMIILGWGMFPLTVGDLDNGEKL